MLLPGEIRENRNVFKVFLKYSLWSFLIIFLLFIYIWQSIITSDLEYKIKKMEEQMNLLSKEKQKMEMEITFLSSPERIGRIAEQELNLVQVNNDNIIWIDCNYDNKKIARK